MSPQTTRLILTCQQILRLTKIANDIFFSPFKSFLTLISGAQNEGYTDMILKSCA